MDVELAVAEESTKIYNQIRDLEKRVNWLEESIVRHGWGEWCYDHDCAVCELNYQGTL